jgi:predicted TIM-barrel fold metal-dependent hydrolase
MTVIDAQVHIWGAETPERPWSLGEAALAYRPTPLGKNELLWEMDAAGVDRAIIVPPSWERERNDLALEAALLLSDRFAVMGRLAIERPESRNLVDTWKCQPGMLGVRLTLHRGAYRTWLTDGTADWFWATAERAGIAVMVFAPGLLPHIRHVVKAYGPHWVFWGTDLPRLRGSYRQAVTFFTEELDFLSDIDTTWIMGRGIAEWLGWPL